MKIYAHVGPGGGIEGLVSVPQGRLSAGLIQDPAFQICEIIDHNLKAEDADLETLQKMLETHRVEVTPATGKLVRHKQ